MAAEQVTHACPAHNVTVLSSSRPDAIDACEGAIDALTFFESHGFRADGKILIEVVHAVPRHIGASASAAGCFLESERRILILTYQRFKALKTWFNIRADRKLYQSIAAHEVAHALAQDNFRVGSPSIQAKEYIAYVVMLATMSDSHRRRVLAAFSGERFREESRISGIAYMFDPMRFGVAAYRHFSRQENGTAYLQAVLSGQALSD